MQEMKKKTKSYLWIGSFIVLALIVGGFIGANYFGNTIIQNTNGQQCPSEWSFLTNPDATGNYISSNSGGTNYQEAKEKAQYYNEDDFCFINSCFFDTKQVYYQCYTNTKP